MKASTWVLATKARFVAVEESGQTRKFRVVKDCDGVLLGLGKRKRRFSIQELEAAFLRAVPGSGWLIVCQRVEVPG